MIRADWERHLERCGINVLSGSLGQLGLFVFRFYNYYGIVDGPMPLSIAEELYASPIGKKDIRAGGDCGCRAPDVWASYFDAEGVELCSDPDGSEQALMDRLIERGALSADAMKGKRFVPDKRVGYARAEVRLYHIDSVLGLELFAQAIRNHRLGTP